MRQRFNICCAHCWLEWLFHNKIVFSSSSISESILFSAFKVFEALRIMINFVAELSTVDSKQLDTDPNEQSGLNEGKEKHDAQKTNHTQLDVWSWPLHYKIENKKKNILLQWRCSVILNPLIIILGRVFSLFWLIFGCVVGCWCWC